MRYKSPYEYENEVPFRIVEADVILFKIFQRELKKLDLPWKESWTFAECYRLLGISRYLQASKDWDFDEWFPKKAGKSNLLDPVSVSRLFSGNYPNKWERKEKERDTEMAVLRKEYERFKDKTCDVIAIVSCAPWPDDSDMTEERESLIRRQGENSRQLCEAILKYARNKDQDFDTDDDFDKYCADFIIQHMHEDYLKIFCSITEEREEI